MRIPALLALAACLAAAGCGGGTQGAQAPASLRILMAADVQTLDPQVPFDNVSSVVLDNIFESLVRFDASFRLTSGLAVRWINPDDKTWRFFLDPEARFPDGSALRARDVVFSIDRLRSLAGSQMTGFTRHIASAEAIDDLTVDIHTDTPVAILNSLAFIPIMSEARVKAAGDAVGQQPFGTGAYRLERWDKGKSIVLAANEHHRPQPAIGRVEFVLRPGGDVLEDVLALRPHLTLFFGRSRLAELEKRKPPELKVVSGGGLSVYYLTFNLRARLPGVKGPNPFRDPRVRRAMSHATDRGALVRDGLKGFGRPAGQLIMPPVVGYDPSIEPTAYDPQAARELLAQAGQSGLGVVIDSVEGPSHWLEKMLMRQWEQAGIRSSLREMTQAEFDRALAGGDFTLTIEGYSCTSGDASEILDYNLHSPDRGRGWGVGNRGGYSNPELDRIAEENLRVFDPRARLEMLQRALRLASQELAYVPLYGGDDLYLVMDAVDFTPAVNEEVRLQSIRFRDAPASPSPR